MPRPLIATVLFAFLLPLAAQTALPPAVTAAQSAVSANSIRAYDKYLFDDLPEGRYPGQRGGQLAAKFIATQFESYGVALDYKLKILAACFQQFIAFLIHQ